MDTIQPDLFAQPGHSAEADVAWFEKLLQGGQVWMTAEDILLSLQRPADEKNKRKLRELANKSHWIISGQKGYRHVEHCTIEEINRCANTLESQAFEMSQRAGRLRRAAHRKIS
jgi:hypothetical protein